MDDPRKFWPSRTEELILRLVIAKPDSYGLALVEASGGKVPRGTIYVLLRRMEEKGLVETREDPSAAPGYIGIARPIYRATALGRRTLRALERYMHSTLVKHDTLHKAKP